MPPRRVLEKKAPLVFLIYTKYPIGSLRYYRAGLTKNKNCLKYKDMITEVIAQKLAAWGITTGELEPFTDKLKPQPFAFTLDHVPLLGNALTPEVAEVLAEIETPSGHDYGVDLRRRGSDNGYIATGRNATDQEGNAAQNPAEAITFAIANGQGFFGSEVEFERAKVDCFPAVWSFGWNPD